MGPEHTWRAGIAWGPFVGAGEVADKDVGEVQPAINAVGFEVVRPCPDHALEHERNILHDNTLVVVWYADCRGIFGQPVFRLHEAGVLRSISRE